MPSVQIVEQLTSVSAIDSRSIKTWRDRVRGEAANALSLANVPPYIVLAVRNSKSLLGLVACYEADDGMHIVHLATRDTGREIVELLINEVQALAGDKRIKAWADYAHLGWRHIGNEYWSK
jgi:hypothetical protein